MRKFCVTLTILIALAAWATPKAEGSMSRGIYVNGKVHFMGFGTAKNNKNQIYHKEAAVNETTWVWPVPSDNDTTNTQWMTFGVCNPAALSDSSMNAAVFNNKIFFTFTANPGCGSSGSRLYLVAYDLTPGVSPSPWVMLTEANGTQQAQPYKDLGAVHHTNTNNNKSPDKASAAIVVFNNLLYVFSDSGTYTSGDGIGWTSYSMLPNNDFNAEPLDAITYYPPDADPRIMIIYGSYSKGSVAYNAIWGANWNGKFGSAMDFRSEKLSLAGSKHVYGSGGLFAGTATGAGFTSGDRTSALQLFLKASDSSGLGTIKRLEYSYSATGGAWKTDAQMFAPANGYAYISTFPWYTTECNANNNIQRQNLVVNYFDAGGYGAPVNPRGFALTSDAMVPQNSDIPINCGSSGGTGTNTGTGTPDEMAMLRKYWTLVGVVIGSPPFQLNGADSFYIEKLSNVTYGQSGSSEVSNSEARENSVILSAGLTVQAGIEHVIGVTDKVDFGFKHAWESEHETSTTSTTSYNFRLGTEYADPDAPENLGKSGWGIFNVPTIVVQNFALYAYDYDTAANTGTFLNQNVHTTQVKPDGLSVSPEAFDLENPGGGDGLMSGIGPFKRSTDLAGWTQGWESNKKDSFTTHYKTLLGDGTKGEPRLNTIRFVNDAGGIVSYSDEIKTVTTTGRTTDVDLSNETDIDVGTELNGFKADLVAGYDGHFSNSVSNTTTLGTEVEAELGMHSCGDADCITSMTIQPFLLQATDANAPWVPSGYNAQLPWAMHWQVTKYTTVDGGRSAISPPADQGSGTVKGGHGLAAKASEVGSGTVDTGSNYSLKGGKMAWRKANGLLRPIPMKAREFIPALGVSVELNGYTWSSSQADGGWARQGPVWIFQTTDSASRDVVVLRLDFSTQTWDFDLSKADLSPFLKPSEGRIHLKLSVNGKYKFYSDCEHEVKIQWDHNFPTTESGGLQLSRYRGSFDPSTGIGFAVLKGALPNGLTHFGDISFSVNGRKINVPLIPHKKYATALAGGSELVSINENGLSYHLDFGKKIWKVRLTGTDYHPRFAPRGNSTTIQVKVGGELWYSGKHAVQYYTSVLNYTGN